MENIKQLTILRQARILKSMPAASVEKNGEISERERLRVASWKKRNQEREAAAKARDVLRTPEEREARNQRIIAKAEKDAKSALKSLKEAKEIQQRGNLLPKAPELVTDYQELLDLKTRLAHSKDKELTKSIDDQIIAAEGALRLRGIDVPHPESDLQGIAEMPATYSAKLLNNLAQSALGITIREAEVDKISVRDGGKTVQIPVKQSLTLEDTLEIVKAVSSNSDLLKNKSEEVEKFGKNLSELALYLSAQTYSSRDSIFTTEAQRQSVIDLYNAGMWLRKLASKVPTPHEKLEGRGWKILERKGKAFVGSEEFTKDNKKKVEILGMLFGKAKITGDESALTPYQKLLRSKRFDGSEKALDDFLAIRGNRLVSMLAPRIADSFAAGRGARAIAQGVSQIQDIAPKVVFEAAREKVARSVLPEQAREYLRKNYPKVDISQLGSLESAASAMGERIEDLPVEQQLSQLADVIRHFQLPGEISGSSTQYDLATVYTNPTAELACTIRAYLLTQVITETYKDQGVQVMANSLLFPDGAGVIGHTRLQVILHGKTYLVDPSIKVRANNGLVGVTDVSGQPISSNEWVGDAFISQEANMLVNMAAGREVQEADRKQLLQMALQNDPNNQMALLHLAALSKDNRAKQDAYLHQLRKLNPGLSEERIQEMIHRESTDFRVAFTTASITDDDTKGTVVNLLARMNIRPGEDVNSNTFLEMYAKGLEPKDLKRIRDELNTLIAAGSVTGPDVAVLQGPGGLIPEIDATISKEGIQTYILQQLKQLEKDGSNPTGFRQLEGNYETTRRLIGFINDLDETTYGQEFINSLRAELHVRSAGHDISFLGRIKGESGVNEMVEAANRFTPEEYLEVESLPGVALVRRLYEQETSHFIAEFGSIGPNDFDTIAKRVNERFEILRTGAAGIKDLPTASNINTLSDFEKLQIGRAISVGKNIFILKTRLAHFIAFGDPVESAKGLAIGNSPWDFLARIYAPYKWMIERYGILPDHSEKVVELIGKDTVNRILYLQDHDSSVWRIPTFLKEFDKRGMHKQALFMRLYWLGEGFNLSHLRKGTPESDLREERRALVEDIIRYVPEELATIFRDVPFIKSLVKQPGYAQFLTDIMQVRETCIKNGDYGYTGFSIPPRSRAIYNDLTSFLRLRAPQLAELGHVFEFTNKHGDEYELINPLFQQRVLSLADAPFELIDKIKNAKGEDILNPELLRESGGQDVGREWNNVSDASKAMQGVVKLLSHPSLEELKELKGLFLYKGAGHDEYVRKEIAKAIFQYVQERPGLRLLMPGIDRLVGRVMGGGSIAQEDLGMLAPSFDTAELEGQIQHLLAEGTITEEGAEEIRKLIYPLVQMALLFRAIPLIQIALAVTIASIIRTAFDPKALSSAA